MKKFAFLMILISFTISLQAQQWEKCNSLLIDSSYVQCLAKSANTIIVGTHKDGIMITTDNGNNWNQINTGISFDITGILSLAVSGDNFLVGTDDGLYISKDSGKIWNHFNNDGLNNLYTPESAIIVNNNKCFYGINGAIFASTDYGNNWEVSASGFQYKRLKCFGFKNDKLYACTSEGLINLSEDWGKTWDSLTTLNVPFSTLNTFDGVLVAGTGKGLYMSNDEGISWSQVNNNLQNIKIYSIVYTNNLIFAGTNQGVYYTAKFDDNWKELNEGFGDKKSVITLIANNNYLFAGSSSKGVYKLKILSISVEDKLINNYLNISPNPANEFITISWKPSEGSEIRIYNILGETVMSEIIQNEESTRINVSDLLKGMYFVKVGDKTAKFMKM